MVKKITKKLSVRSVQEERDPVPPTEPNSLDVAFSAGDSAYRTGKHNPPDNGRERFAYYEGFFAAETALTARDENVAREHHR